MKLKHFNRDSNVHVMDESIRNTKYSNFGHRYLTCLKVHSLIYIMLALVLSMSSCKKFLDEKSDKRLVELKTLEDLQAMLDNELYMNRSTTSGFGEASADDYFLNNARFSSLSDLDNRIYTWQVKEYNYPNDWARAYHGIYVANYVLDHLENITVTSANKKEYDNAKGAAYFFKSFFYLSLIWDYGRAYNKESADRDPGIVLREDSDPTIKSVRTTVGETYKEIIKSAENAVELLAENQITVLRPSKTAALGLLARVYLSMREYNNAYKYSDQCLRLKSDLVNFSNPSLNLNARPVFKTFNEEVIFYSTQTVNHTTKSPAMAFVDTLLYDSYQTNDLRKKAYFFANAGYRSFKGTYSQFGFTQLFSGIAVDEIYLIRSESALKMTQPNIKQALDDLNTLLKNRFDNTFTPYTNMSISDAILLVQKERRKELLMRGFRWIDIKRLNMENANIELIRKTQVGEFKLQANDRRFTLPLPSDIVVLTGIEQN